MVNIKSTDCTDKWLLTDVATNGVDVAVSFVAEISVS